jgi:hypothetical protein
MRDGIVRSRRQSRRSEARDTFEPTGGWVGVDEPFEVDESPVTMSDAETPRRDARAEPVLDEDKMSQFVALMGPDWATKGLRRFAIDVEHRLASLGAATSSDLAHIAHGMIGVAAHFGFLELSAVSVEVQREARRGAGLNRIAELRAAGERALAVMRSHTPRPG